MFQYFYLFVCYIFFSVSIFILQIVFNVVASVKFNEKIGDAIDINVLGTKKILDLAMEMKNLKVCKSVLTNCLQNKIYINIYYIN